MNSCFTNCHGPFICCCLVKTIHPDPLVSPICSLPPLGIKSYACSPKTLISTRLCSKKKWIEPTALNTGNPVYDFYEKWNFSSHPVANNYKAPGAIRHGLSTTLLKLPAQTCRPISYALQKNLSHSCLLHMFGFPEFYLYCHIKFPSLLWWGRVVLQPSGMMPGNKHRWQIICTITPSSHIWPPSIMWESQMEIWPSPFRFVFLQ